MDACSGQFSAIYSIESYFTINTTQAEKRRTAQARRLISRHALSFDEDAMIRT